MARGTDQCSVIIAKPSQKTRLPRRVVGESGAPVIRSRARSCRGTTDPVAEGDCVCGRTGARRDWVRRAASRVDASRNQMTVAPCESLPPCSAGTYAYNRLNTTPHAAVVAPRVLVAATEMCRGPTRTRATTGHRENCQRRSDSGARRRAVQV